MLLHQNSIKVVEVTAGSNDKRLALQGILIEPDGSGVGCNGHILLKFTPKQPANPEEFPKIEGVNPENKQELEAFILPANAGSDILKSLPKKKSLPGILSFVALDTEKTNNNGQAYLATTDLTNPRTFTPTKLEESYPNYKHVFPVEQPMLSIGLTVDVVLKAFKTLKALGAGNVKLDLINSERAIRVSTETEDGNVEGVIMPCRLDDAPVKIRISDLLDLYNKKELTPQSFAKTMVGKLENSRSILSEAFQDYEDLKQWKSVTSDKDLKETIGSLWLYCRQKKIVIE